MRSTNFQSLTLPPEKKSSTFSLCFNVISPWNSERIEILASIERKSLTKRGSSEGLNRHLICLCLRHSLAHSLLFSSEQEECGFNKLMKFLHKKKRLVKIQDSLSLCHHPNPPPHYSLILLCCLSSISSQTSFFVLYLSCIILIMLKGLTNTKFL